MQAYRDINQRLESTTCRCQCQHACQSGSAFQHLANWNPHVCFKRGVLCERNMVAWHVRVPGIACQAQLGCLGASHLAHLVPSMTTSIEALPEHTSEESVPKKHGQHHIGHTWAGQSIKTPQGSAPCPKAGLQLFTAGAPMRQPGYSLATVWPDLDSPKPLVLSKIVTVSRISK